MVVLENGDRIEGLIEGINQDLHIEQADGSLNDIPLDRIASFALVNDRISDSGFSNTGFISVCGETPAARACNA